MKKKLLIYFFLFCNVPLFSQNIIGHSHNDYEHPRPFYDAFELGFESIEVDVWLNNNEIYVAHDFNRIKLDRTFEALYLLPMLKEMAKKENKSRKLLLLIDVKANHKKLLPILIEKLKPYKKYLNQKLNKSGITIAISGDRPLPNEYVDYPKYIFFDGRIEEEFSKKIDRKIALISNSIAKFGNLMQNDTSKAIDTEKKIKKFVISSQARGKKTRLWGTPNSEIAYNKLSNLGLVYIGTDSLASFANWFQKINR